MSYIPPGTLAFLCDLDGDGLCDPLQGNVPFIDPANGLGFPNGLLNKNLIIQSNIFQENAPVPAPGSGLVGLGPDLCHRDLVQACSDCSD